MLGVSTDPSSSPEVSPIPTKTNTQSINDPIHHFLCLPESFSDLNTYITGLLTFLKTYKNLWKFHAVEFFIDDYWNSDAISSEWRETLGSDDVSIEDLFYFASENRVKDSWPESLKRYAQDIAQISLPRFPNDLMEMNPEYQEWMNKIRASAVPLNTALHTHGMSPKKIHEVELLASLIDLAAKETESRTIIDIGAGQGYLSSALSYQYGHTVIGVDDSEIQTCGAIRRSEFVYAKGKNHFKYIQPTSTDGDDAQDQRAGRVYFLRKRIEGKMKWSEVVKNVIEEAVQSSTNNDNDNTNNNEPNPKQQPTNAPTPESESVLLCGLHTCGDLGPTILRHFISSDAKSMVNIGCCYNKMTERFDIDTLFGEVEASWDESIQISSNGTYRYRAPEPTTPPSCNESSCHEPVFEGFPMSQQLSKHKLFLGFTARMVACQSVWKWTLDLPGSVFCVRKHFFRALLQYLIKSKIDASNGRHEYDSSRIKIEVGRLKDRCFKDFQTYVGIAVEKLGLAEDLHPTKEEIDAVYTKFQDKEKQVACMWTLRAMLGQAIESLVLADRVAWLLERNEEYQRNPENGVKALQVSMFPLFDPVSSPRNIAIVANKIWS